MNMARYLERNRHQIANCMDDDVPVLELSTSETVESSETRIAFRPDGLAVLNRLIPYSHIRSIDHNLSLRQIHDALNAGDISKSSISEICFLTIAVETAGVVELLKLSLSTRSAIRVVEFVERLLRTLRKSGSEPHTPTADRQAYCPTCQTYKRPNSAGRCRLCGDGLVWAD